MSFGVWDCKVYQQLFINLNIIYLSTRSILSGLNLSSHTDIVPADYLAGQEC